MTLIPGTAVSDSAGPSGPVTTTTAAGVPPVNTRKRVSPELKDAELITLHEVRASDGSGEKDQLVGFFTDAGDAHEHAREAGPYSSAGTVYERRALRLGTSLYVLGTPFDVAQLQTHDPEAAKNRALAKLTEYDKRVLGLVK